MRLVRRERYRWLRRRGHDRGGLGLHLLLGLSGPAQCQAGLHLCELAMCLGEGLVEAPGLLLMPAVGVADERRPSQRPTGTRREEPMAVTDPGLSAKKAPTGEAPGTTVPPRDAPCSSPARAGTPRRADFCGGDHPIRTVGYAGRWWPAAIAGRVRSRRRPTKRRRRPAMSASGRRPHGVGRGATYRPAVRMTGPVSDAGHRWIP